MRAGSGHPAMRPGRVASVLAAACLMAVVSACSSAATAPSGETARRPPSAAEAATASPSAPATAGPAPASTAPVPLAPAVVPQCGEKSLATAVSGYQIAGSQYGIVLKLTNVGAVSCSLYGYPGLGLEDGSHRVLPSQVHWGATYFAHDPGPSLIVLAAGQSATSSVSFAGGWPHQGWAWLLEVTPPNAYDHAVIGMSYGTGGAGGDIHATAMARHTTIYRGSPGGCGCQSMSGSMAGSPDEHRS